MNGAERQGNTFIKPLHHIPEISFYPGAINQHWADNDNLHTRFRRELTKPLLCLHLGNAIRVCRGRCILRRIGGVWQCAFSVYLDRTDKDKPSNTGRSRMTCQVERAIHIDLPKGSQGVGFSVIHYMNTSC
ncbi:hypothetical protein D3C80_1668760 [compost metagenome]